MKLRDSILGHAGFLILLSRAVVGYENGLARTPQMGWNTWNRFGCDIDEDLIVESAKVVAEKLRVYGYECECRPPYAAWMFVTLFILRYCNGRLSVSLLDASACRHLISFCRLARHLEGPRHWCSPPRP